MNIDLEKDLPHLEHIPGLQVNERTSTAGGPVDVEAVIGMRLGRKPPQNVVLNSFDEFEGLRKYQVMGVNALMNFTERSGAALLADEMGLGKTRQAIVWALMQDLQEPRYLVVCPASVRETWRAELEGFGQVLKEQMSILGPPSDRYYQDDWRRAPDATWVVAGYGANLAKAHKAAFASRSPDLVIWDEAQLLCGRKAERAKLAQELSKLAWAKLFLTGTPVWDKPKDLYMLLKTMGLKVGTQREFDLAYCAGAENAFGYIEPTGVSRADELKLRLSYYMVRRTKAQVASELPPMSIQVLWQDADRNATREYQRWTIHHGDFGAEAMKAALKAKEEEALRLAGEAGRFLLLTWMREDAERLASMLGVSFVHGGLSHHVRSARIQEAARQGKGIVATIDACGVGVDGLQHVASVGIMHYLHMKPRELEQAMARLHRLNTKAPVTWYALALRDSIDTAVVEKCITKLDMQRVLMSEEKGNSLRLAMSESTPREDAGNALRRLYDES